MLSLLNIQRRLMPDEPDNSIPGFAASQPGEASENEEDESEILTDQDLTEKLSQWTDDENMGAKSNSLDALEDEPDDFLTGEVDVREQMDRAAAAMDASIHGLQNQGYEDSPRTELGASFQETPGGLEEVEQKTDQALAQQHHTGRTGRRGHKTGAYTDLGAGRSATTRIPNKNEIRH